MQREFDRMNFEAIMQTNKNKILFKFCTANKAAARKIFFEILFACKKVTGYLKFRRLSGASGISQVAQDSWA